VELRRGVSTDRAGGVVLELRGNKLARCFGRMVAADPRLRIPLKLGERRRNRCAMGLTHPLIAANKRGQRDRLRRGKSRVPTCPVFDRFRGRAVSVFILLRLAMLHHRLVSLRMAAFAEAGEFFGGDGSAQTHPGRKLALPFTLHDAILLVVIRRLGGELQLVIRLCLAGAERL
jgi:hypothetical protein